MYMYCIGINMYNIHVYAYTQVHTKYTQVHTVHIMYSMYLCILSSGPSEMVREMKERKISKERNGRLCSNKTSKKH